MNAEIDLALLGFDRLRELGRQQGIVGCDGLARPELVCALRDAGIGSHWTCSSKSQSDTLTSLVDQVTCLTKELSLITSMKAEILTLKADLADLRALSVPHDSLQSYHPAGALLKPTLPAVTVQPQNLRTSPNATQIETRPAKNGTYHPPALYSTTVQAGHQGPNKAHDTRNETTVPSTRVTSYYENRPKPSEQLSGGSRTKCCALYLGNVKSGCSSDSIAKWCTRREIQVIKCSVSETKYFGVAFAHVVIPAEHKEPALGPDFWPPEVTAREWRFKQDRITSDHASNP